jgi:prepilin-type N-terminal cleavage/methylation domain-containing protein
MRSERGFSLVEVLLASSIITTVIVGVTGLFVLSMKANAASGDQTECVALAQERLEKLKHQDYSTLVNGGSVSSCVVDYCDLVDLDGNGRDDFQLLWAVGPATAITTAMPGTTIDILALDVRCTSLRSREGQPGAPKVVMFNTYRTKTVSE